MSDEDCRKWDARYREQKVALTEPATFLTSITDRLPTDGSAVDVAGGGGRNAIWLAQRGLDVTLLDISSEALRLAQQAADHAGVKITTEQIDLVDASFPVGPWDLIFSCDFLQRSLFAIYPNVLRIGGTLAVAQPTTKNLERHPRPPSRFLLKEGELRELASPLEVIYYDERWQDNDHHEARLVARRIPNRNASGG